MAMPVRVFLSTRYFVEEPRSASRSSPMSLTLSPRYSVSSAATASFRYPLMASTSAILLGFGTASPRFGSTRPSGGGHDKKRTVPGPPAASWHATASRPGPRWTRWASPTPAPMMGFHAVRQPGGLWLAQG